MNPSVTPANLANGAASALMPTQSALLCVRICVRRHRIQSHSLPGWYMERVAAKMAARGAVLRSGAANGADTYFETGCDRVGGSKEIYLPWPSFNGSSSALTSPSSKAYDLASQVHPAWAKLKHPVRRLHARNCHQILGADLNDAVQLVICWTPDGCEDEASRGPNSGGTATAIVLASRHAVPVFNLARPDAVERLRQWWLAHQDSHPSELETTTWQPSSS
jgi:hypothetical protein